MQTVKTLGKLTCPRSTLRNFGTLWELNPGPTLVSVRPFGPLSKNQNPLQIIDKLN